MSQLETTEAPAQGASKPHNRRSNQWSREFPDISVPPGEDIGEFYYRSECRPLKHLKPMHREMVIGKSTKLGFRAWLDERDRARKDLYWLGKHCIATPESGSGFVEHVHREMVEICGRKNFDGVYHKGWTLDEVRAAIDRQLIAREVLMLCPTGAFKSTVNKIDAVQWMLNVPDIRIFIMTGSGPLSRKFLREVKGFFFKAAGTPLTRFQSLFPEFVVEGQEGESMAPLFCPARIHAQPGTPTLWVNSIDGTVAGWHCDLWLGDDVVNEDNSNNEDTRDTLKQRYDNVSGNRPDKWAFRRHLGTRYYPDDWYGTRIEEARQYPDTNAIQTLIRSAWTVKPEFAHVPIKKLQEHMVTLYFPEFMPFSLLIKKCRANEKQFRCQQLNEPEGGDLACNFEQAAIERHTILLNAVPRPANGIRRPAIIWDTAHGNKVQSDYSAGAVGWCYDDTRTLYVLEVEHGKWKDSECAVRLVDLHWKWDARFSEVEKFHGWELFAAEVQRVSLHRWGKYLPLLWRETDTTAGSKRNWVKGVETLLANDRIYFVDGDWMEETTRQFLQFTGFSKRRKDDIPDAISKLQRLIPRESLGPPETSETDAQRKAREARELREKFAEQQRNREYSTIFQVPAVAPAPAPTPAPADPGPGWIFGRTGIHL